MTNISVHHDGSMYYHNNLSSFVELHDPITQVEDKWHIVKDDENNVAESPEYCGQSEKSMVSNYSKLSQAYAISVTR